MIELLSKKPLCQFTPEDFKEYVRSLYSKPDNSTSRGFSFHVNKQGTLVLRSTKRKPKFLTKDEIKEISEETGKSLSEIHFKMVEKGWLEK